MVRSNDLHGHLMYTLIYLLWSGLIWPVRMYLYERIINFFEWPMLCRQCATAAKVARALSKTMTTPNAQRQGCLEWWRSLFFFKVRQEFIQEFACDQSWILSFGVFRVAPTWKRLHQKSKTQSGIHSRIHSDSSTVYSPNALCWEMLVYVFLMHDIGIQ